jgi:hypothetical protein
MLDCHDLGFQLLSPHPLVFPFSRNLCKFHFELLLVDLLIAPFPTVVFVAKELPNEVLVALHTTFH